METLLIINRSLSLRLTAKVSLIIKINMQKFYQNRWFKFGLPLLVVVAVIAGTVWYSSESDFFQGYLRRAAPVPTPSEPVSQTPPPTLAECKQYKLWFASCTGTCMMDGDIRQAVKCEEQSSTKTYWHDWPTSEECATLDKLTADPADVAYCETGCLQTETKVDDNQLNARCELGEKPESEEPALEAQVASLEITEGEEEEEKPADEEEQQLYSDVPATHPQYTAIMYVSDELGAFSGYPDFTFKPAGIINRAEFMKVVSIWLDLAPVSGDSEFPDVLNGSWYEPYVNAAVAAGIVSGYDNGNFGPGDDVTQGALMKIVVNGSIFADLVDENYGAEWYEKYYKVAIDNNLFDAADMAPLDLASRGLAAELIYKADKSV